MSMLGKNDFRSVSGSQKAAMLMLSLGEEHAMRIFTLLDEDEIKELSQAMANLGSVDSEMVERLFVEFTERMSATGSLHGTIESTERLLAKALPRDQVDGILEEIRGPAGRTMWDKLGNVNEEVLANYLKNEYPQTVALVLSKVKPEHAARVLEMLPEDFAIEVVMRMLRMEVVQKDILDGVEKTLRTEFMSNLARTNRRDPHEMMAEIFNNLDRNNEGRFLSALEDRNRVAAEKIKALMFTFEDLTKLAPSGVQTLIRTVDKSKMALALKGASDQLKDLFFSNMSERAGKLLREDMEAMGPVRLRDVDEAQTYLVNTAKELAAKGEIVIADSKGDDELVY
jgi:flagellar motor switch protein FliG